MRRLFLVLLPWQRNVRFCSSRDYFLCLLTKERNEAFDTTCRYWLADVFHTSLNQELRAFNTQLDSFVNSSSIFVANLPVNLVLRNELRTQQHDMDLVRHQYVYPHHHPYRLGGIRYGAVSPYQVVTIPRCTCECFCERNRVQFVGGESRNSSEPDREGRGRDMDDLKNGMFSFKVFFLVSFISRHYQRVSNINVYQVLTDGEVLNERFASFTHPVL